jgi:hypothetical protein
VLLNGFNTLLEVKANFLNDQFLGLVAGKDYLNEIYKRKERLGENQLIPVIKDQEWMVWTGLAVGIILMIAGGIWFLLKFERDRRRGK